MPNSNEKERLRAHIAALGGAKKVGEELCRFSQSAQKFAESEAEQTKGLERQWIGIENGQVRAFADTLESLLEKTDHLGIPRRMLMVEFVEDEVRRMIL